jgi:hypothetical protein
MPPLGDILKPLFDLDGKILGFTIRQNMVEKKTMAKVIKSCIYMNRLIRDGLNESLKLEKIVRNEMEQKFNDVEI